METIEELQVFLETATRDNIRMRLLDRGEARAIIRRAGQLPDDAPAFGETLDTDLSEYGFSLLRAALTLREHESYADVCRDGFLKAGNAFEALVRNGSPQTLQRGLWRAMSAASYHLAGYSAMAFSLLRQREEDPNFSPGELALVRLLLRDLQALKRESRTRLLNSAHQDGEIRERLDDGSADFDDVIAEILTTTIYRAFAIFDFALATGAVILHEEALKLLRTALRVARDFGVIPLWWVIRVALNVIDDLWNNSLNTVLPVKGPQGAAEYGHQRGLFLASLYARNIAEVELWPSQLEAARRATDLDDDLVISLPTSAGKTRVAEICALMSLSAQRRVLILTPLRALSAQTERSFRRTFDPLGFSVSSLYGASGALPGDDNALRTRKIVITTPEKLDFALRGDPTLIDDVGLIVLDEGHLIGPGERELRYEVLVQRLLRRADGGQRRIVCLSAILPDGEQLDDLTAWIRGDADGDPVKSEWRPTRQRFGTLAWTGQTGRLTFGLDDDGPYIQRFVERQPSIPPRRTPFPKDNPELTLAAAWRFADEGKRTLVFCTQRDHVESYARKIIGLSRRGFLLPLLDDAAAIVRAQAIGAEWLGADHPAVQCLRIGVAIHHARLPNPFLREVERLLNDGILAVTVASPTLAQGLNLNATVLLIPNLYRAGTPLSGEEFANVAGRAGRAFVDLEGLVVHVMHQPERWRRQAWRELVHSSRARSLESGLIQIAVEVLRRLARSGILNQEEAFEYLANNRRAWDIQVDEEGDEPLDQLLEKLDNTILGLIEALDAASDDLPQLIDEALSGSLWARQIARRAEGTRERQLELFKARSRLIWSNTTPPQRRGHFAMGVGLEAGLTLDTIADELAVHLDRADLAALLGDLGVLQDALAHLAERLLSVRPFAPVDPLPEDWQDILFEWLAGVPVQEIGANHMRFIEDAFAYRFVWALEALRMRRVALGWEPETIAGGAAACVESGLPRFVMAMLVRAGLPSRAAALVAIEDLNPVFVDNTGLVEWLKSNEVATLTDAGEWPTAETASIWAQFRREVLGGAEQKWFDGEWRRNVDHGTYLSEPIPDRPYRVEVDDRDNSVWVCTPDFQRVVKLRRTMIDRMPSVLHARFEEGSSRAIVKRLGRSRPKWSDS